MQKPLPASWTVPVQSPGRRLGCPQWTRSASMGSEKPLQHTDSSHGHNYNILSKLTHIVKYFLLIGPPFNITYNHSIYLCSKEKVWHQVVYCPGCTQWWYRQYQINKFLVIALKDITYVKFFMLQTAVVSGGNANESHVSIKVWWVCVRFAALGLLFHILQRVQECESIIFPVSNRKW